MTLMTAAVATQEMMVAVMVLLKVNLIVEATAEPPAVVMAEAVMRELVPAGHCLCHFLLLHQIQIRRRPGGCERLYPSIAPMKSKMRGGLKL